MKLRLPNKLVAAIMAAASPVLFQTLSTATVGAAAVAMVGQMAQGDETPTYSWTTTQEGILVPAKDDEAISYDAAHTISNGSTLGDNPGDIKITATGNFTLSSNLGAASSIYLDNGYRMQVTSSTLLGSSPIFIKGGQLWYKGSSSSTLSNDFYIGTSTYGGGENCDKAAIRIQSNCTLSGNITLGEDARMAVTTGVTATLSGNISGDGKALSLLASHNPGTFNLSGTNTLGSLNIAETNVGSWSNSVTVNINGETSATAVSIGTAQTGVLNIGANGSLLASSIIVDSHGTLKVGNNNALGAASATRTIRVNQGGVLDVNGKSGANHTVTLNGGTLTNTGSVVTWQTSQFVKNLVLEANSSVSANNNNYGLVGDGFAVTHVNLSSYNLEKTGSKIFFLTNSEITGSGALVVTGGSLEFRQDGSGTHGSMGANIVMNGGSVTGSSANAVNLSNDVSVTAKSTSGAFSANVNLNSYNLTLNGTANQGISGLIKGTGSIIKSDENTMTLSGANSYSGGTTISGGILKMGNASALG